VSRLAAQRTRNALISGTLLLFAGRLAISLSRSGPVLVADDIDGDQVLWRLNRR